MLTVTGLDEELKMMALQDPSVDDEDEGKEEAAAREKGWATVGRSVLRGGWGLGKKVVIAAAAITSVSVVIPPLLLVSTLGLALAFPFGVYFAGFACTDKLMRSLLPLPSPLQWEEEEEDEDEEGYEGEAEAEAEAEEEEEVRDEEGFDIKAAREETGDRGLVEDEEEPIGETETTPDPWSKELAPCVYPSAAAVAPELRDEGEAEGEVRDAAVKETGNGGLTKEEEPSGETGTPDPLPPAVYPYMSVVPTETWVEVEHSSSEEKGEEGSVKKVEQENLPSIGYVEMKAAVEEMENGGWMEEEGAAGDTGPPAASDSQIEIRPISGYGIDNENPLGVEIPEEEKPMERIGNGDEKQAEECGIEMEYSSSKDKGEEGSMEKVVEVEKLMTSVTYPSVEEYCELEMPPSLGYVKNHGNLGSIEIVVEEKPAMESEVAATSQELPPCTYPLAMVALVECEAVIEPPNVRSEYASIVEEKKSGEIIKIPEVLKPKQRIGEERVGRMKEEGVDAAAPEGDVPPSRAHKIEIVPSSVTRSRSRGGIEMVQEERSMGDEKEGEEDTKEERSMTDAAPKISEHDGLEKKELEPYGLSSEYASAVEDYRSSDMDTESRDSIEHGVDTPAEEATMPSDDEGLYNEEQIWEQIYAIRKIVGYRVTLHSSLVGELRALYLFTGVDPPVSFKDTSDLADVNEKLQFLKSVIGVR